MNLKSLIIIIISGSLILVKASDLSIGDSLKKDLAPWLMAQTNDDKAYQLMAQRNLTLYIGCKTTAAKPIQSISLKALNELSELGWQRIPGVGPSLAKVIVAHIKAHGPFESIEEINEVKGIGPKKFEGIRQVILP